MEGKEVRFGDTSSALYATTSTQTSTGSVDSAEDSFTPMGGFAVLTGMMLGEVSPGGVGSGLYGMLLFAIIAVFIGGLMVGRTPEYLGKKIQAREVKLAALGVSPRVAERAAPSISDHATASCAHSSKWTAMVRPLRPVVCSRAQDGARRVGGNDRGGPDQRRSKYSWWI